MNKQVSQAQLADSQPQLIEHSNSLYIDDIASFHGKFGLHAEPDQYLDKHAAFRQGFLLEELHELGEAFGKGDLVKYLDALVDLDYVALGTAFLLGQSDEFRINGHMQYMHHLRKDMTRPHQLGAPQPPLPGQYVFFLGNAYTYLGVVFHAIMMAKRGGNQEENYRKATDALMQLHRTIVDHAFMCGLNFIEAWQRVHNANMTKRRAEKTSDSKRGSTVDVVKPEGWVPPDLSDLVGGEVDENLPSFLAASPA